MISQSQKFKENFISESQNKFNCDQSSVLRSWKSLFDVDGKLIYNEDEELKALFPKLRLSNYNDLSNKRILMIGNSMLRQCLEAIVYQYYDNIIDIKRFYPSKYQSLATYFDHNSMIQTASTRLVSCERNCVFIFKLGQIEMKNNVTVFGTFNSVLNLGLHDGNGLLHVLDFFNTKLEEIDVIILNKGNSLAYLNESSLSKTFMKTYLSKGLLHLHNVRSIVVKLVELNFKGKLYLTQNCYGVDSGADEETFFSSPDLSNIQFKVKQISLDTFLKYDRICSYPNCNSWTNHSISNWHQCMPGPPFDAAKAIIETLF